jgi:hypothetical protein
MVTVGKVLQTPEAVNAFKDNLLAYVQTTAGGGLTKEEANDFYLMIQKASQERLDNRGEIQEAYQRINETYRTEQGYKSGRRDKVSTNNPTGASKFGDSDDDYRF